ncbi:hypothetical protein K1X76_03785 [bacterium]|nr:hypothetical protein [bacterium]
MYTQNINIGVSRTSGTSSTSLKSDHDLEVSVATGLIDDINTQLTQMSQDLQSSLEQKQALDEKTNYLGTISTHTPQTIDNVLYLTISAEEKEKLKELGLKEENFKEVDGQLYVTPESVNALSENFKTQKQNLNSMDELSMLKVQSLMDQRKNMMMLLSNMMASNNETLSAIVRNIKN